MLAGLRSGQVHLLHRKGGGDVHVTRNDRDIVGWSADEILRSFMDVSAPTALVTEENLARLRKLRSRRRLNSSERKELESLREQIHLDLLGGPVSSELQDLESLLKLSREKEPASAKARDSVGKRGRTAQKQTTARSATKRTGIRKSAGKGKG